MLRFVPQIACWRMLDDVVRGCVKFDFGQVLTKQKRNILSRLPMLRSFDRHENNIVAVEHAHIRPCIPKKMGSFDNSYYNNTCGLRHTMLRSIVASV